MPQQQQHAYLTQQHRHQYTNPENCNHPQITNKPRISDSNQNPELVIQTKTHRTSKADGQQNRNPLTPILTETHKPRRTHGYSITAKAKREEKSAK